MVALSPGERVGAAPQTSDGSSSPGSCARVAMIDRTYGRTDTGEN